MGNRQRKREVQRKGRDTSMRLGDHDGGCGAVEIRNQTETQSTVQEKILNLMERTGTIESYVYEVLITNQDSTEATSVVSRHRRCKQPCKECGAYSSHSYVAEWPCLDLPEPVQQRSLLKL